MLLRLGLRIRNVVDTCSFHTIYTEKKQNYSWGEVLTNYCTYIKKKNNSSQENKNKSKHLGLSSYT